MRQFSVKKSLHAAALLSGLFSVLPAFAHPGHPAALSAFQAGFFHPFSGVDHLLALLAIGLWALHGKRPAAALTAAACTVVMALGAALGIALGAFGGMESGLASSVAILGLLIAFAVKMPAVLSAMIVAGFALLHGYAHGTELPPHGSAYLYVGGFMLASLLLQLCGAAIGALGHRLQARQSLRIIGSGLAASGIYLMTLV